MGSVERNRTLVPFCAAALLLSAALCVGVNVPWPRWLWLFPLLSVAGTAALLALFVLGCVLVSLFLPGAETPPSFHPGVLRFISYVMGMVCALARVRVRVSGLERLPEQGRFLLVCNHRSGFDPLLTGWVLRRRRLVFIMKPSISAMPVVGRYLRLASFLPIDRENDRAALKTILTAAKLMREDVTSVAVYPEGTRSDGPGLLPFRNGAFKAAQRAGVPLAVAALRGTERIARRAPWRSTEVCLDVVAVIPPEDAAAMKTPELGDLAREHMLSILH